MYQDSAHVIIEPKLVKCDACDAVTLGATLEAVW